jgi:Protein of unknown function (DUF3810)
MATARMRVKGAKGRSSRRRVWLPLLLIAIALGLWFMPIAPEQIERDYSTSVYLAMQRALTASSNVVPVALFDVMLGIAVVALIVRIVMRVRQVRQTPRGRPWRRTGRALSWIALDLSATAAVLAIWFSLTWGGNYRRMPLRERLDFDRARVTREAALEMTRTSVRELNRLHPIAHARPWPALETLPATLGGAFADVQHAIGQPALAVAGRPKSTVMQAWFQWAAIDGMTDPFFLETLVNTDALPIERPFIVTHEWSHLAGFAHEAEANFLAWVICQRADTQAQYSAWLSLYFHLAGGLAPADRRAIDADLQDGPRRDMRAIVARYQRSAPRVRVVAWQVYDRYLKANRVSEGIASYDAVVTLILGTKFSNDWIPAVKTTTRLTQPTE